MSTREILGDQLKSSIDNNIIDFLHNPIVNGNNTHIQKYYNLRTQRKGGYVKEH